MPVWVKSKKDLYRKARRRKKNQDKPASKNDLAKLAEKFKIQGLGK